MEATAAGVAFWQLARDATKLYTRVRSAEETLTSTTSQLDHLESFCQSLSLQCDEKASPFAQSAKLLVSSNKELIKQFQQRTEKYNDRVRKRDLLELALKALPRLQRLEGSVLRDSDLAAKYHIMHTQQVMNERIKETATKSGIAGLATSEEVSKLPSKEDILYLAALLQEKQSATDATICRSDSHSHIEQASTPTHSWSVTSPRLLKLWFGFQGALIGKRRQGNRKLIMTIQFHLPLMSRMWYSNVLFRNSSFRGSAGFSTVVAEDDPFLRACRDGDIYTIRTFCHGADGIPGVVSKDNMTPLLYAVQAGRTDVVQLLLSNGADVNRCGGPKHTSPVQWAIKFNHLDVLRLLMDEHADLDYVSSIHWSPVFYCWPDLKASWEDRTDILKLLMENSNLNTQESDTLEWSALQRAAAFGTKEDMRLMITMWEKLQGNYRWKSLPIAWEAIHYAVHAGNSATFGVLLELYGEQARELLDARGWSLLHMAATRPCTGPPNDSSFNQMSIVRDLLRLGCDPFLQTQPTRAENLEFKAYTPEDLARRTGSEFHTEYMKALNDHLGLCDGGSDDEFFDCV